MKYNIYIYTPLNHVIDDHYYNIVSVEVAASASLPDDLGSSQLARYSSELFASCVTP